ncbi:MAG: fatty acid desaturase [Cyanobacteria bacterium P01_F01_bin.150]
MICTSLFSDAIASEKPKLDPELLKSFQALNCHPMRLPMFIGLYAIALLITIPLAAMVPGPWHYLLCFPGYLLAAASLHGISLFTHEGVHGVLSRNAHWNRALGIACALPVLQNFSAYKVLHLEHHNNLGLDGDPDHYKNYTRWSWLVSAMHWARLLIGYPVYITAIPILGFRAAAAGEKLWVIFEVLLLGILGTAIVWSPIPSDVLIHGWLIPMILINTMVNIRGMSQHTLLEHEADLIRGTRTILTNPITRFFMCNENYHLEHHLYPSVPWYHLPKVHDALKDELIERGAPFIPSYTAFVQEFVLASLRRSSHGSVVINR